MEVGNTKMITATILPERSDTSVIWKSSNTSVATVSDNGQITAVGAGKTIITASAGLMIALCEVTVYTTNTPSTNISGTITSYGNVDNVVTVSLMSGDEEVNKVETTDGAYELTSVPSGTYTLQITKANHVTRTYEITVGSENITQDVKLCLLGDVTGDGKVNTRDLNRIYAHVNGTDPLTDYPFACGDVIGADGKINTRDLNRLYAHINESNPLWAEN